MLVRDTPITTFEYHCPRTLLPPDGAAARCIADAIAAERPFVAELHMPRPVPRHEQPLLVGASFNGRYEARAYKGYPSNGERVRLLFEPDLDATGELAFTVDTKLRCLVQTQPPAYGPATDWQTLADTPSKVGHRFHPDACVEWFDAKQWAQAPWPLRFDPSVSLACVDPNDQPTEAPDPAPPVEVDPVSAAACEAGDGPACVAAARSVAPRGAYRVSLTKDEADRRERETTKYAALGCKLDQAEACALQAKYGPWHEREVPLARACELDHACACAKLGSALTTIGHGKDDILRGLELLERACVAGHRELDDGPSHEPGKICDDVAGMYTRGRESMFEPDPAKAKQYLALACKQGYILACTCKRDEDCGGPPYYCLEEGDSGWCTMPSDCMPQDDEDDEDEAEAAP